MLNISTFSPQYKSIIITQVGLSLTVLSFVDYETLRTTGVILAVIMFVSGILIALSKFLLHDTSIQRLYHIYISTFTMPLICHSSYR